MLAPLLSSLFSSSSYLAFTFPPLSLCILFPFVVFYSFFLVFFLYCLSNINPLVVYGHMAQWKRIRLRIWGLQVRALLCSPFYLISFRSAWFLMIDSSPFVPLSLLLAFLFRYLPFSLLSYTLWSFFILYSLIVLFFDVILVSWERSSVGRA